MAAVELIMGAAPALLVGAGIAWWVVARKLKRQFDVRLHFAVGSMRKQHEAVVDKLTSTHEAAKKELERLRSAPPRSVPSAEQRQSLERLEEQLRVAYAELDRLRLQVNGPAPVGRRNRINGHAGHAQGRGASSPRATVTELSHGFAATQPFES